MSVACETEGSDEVEIISCVSGRMCVSKSKREQQKSCAAQQAISRNTDGAHAPLAVTSAPPW